MITTHLPRTAHLESWSAGILGWTAIHVHANIVERQLQSILYIDRVLPHLVSSLQMKMD